MFHARIVLAAFLVGACSVEPAAVNAQFEVEPAFPALSFEAPVDLQHAGDGSGRLFVVEQEGRIRVFDNDPQTETAAVFLDIRDRVRYGGERGLLGLAFHPEYADNGTFFVDYTADDPARTVVARYRVDPSDPDRADPASEAVVLEVAQPYGNHNGGQVAFGPDGYLYVALGDGGSRGDPDGNGQDLTTLLGSILRLDVDAPSGGRAYGIPEDNPFAGNGDGYREEIYAYGLRNPWRFGFDPPTGRLWTGDVGQNAYEEVDVVEAGGNYGWDVMEGLHCYEPASGCDADGLTPPVWEYPHDEGQSITGGFVYRGRRVPELAGRYVFGDYVSGRVWALVHDGAAVTGSEVLLAERVRGLSSFGVDAEGELYLVDHGGAILRFVATAGTAVTPAEAPGRAHRLGPVYPNPGGGAVMLSYTLAVAGRVELSVHDARGRRVGTVVRDVQPAGAYAVPWEGAELPGGVYFYRLLVDGVHVAARRAVHVRP